MSTLTGFAPMRSHRPLSTCCQLSPHRNVSVAVWRATIELGKPGGRGQQQ